MFRQDLGLLDDSLVTTLLTYNTLHFGVTFIYLESSLEKKHKFSFTL